MSLVRFDPFRELENIQSRLNRFFNDMPARTADEDMFFTDWAPAVDIQENEKEYLVKADLPEVKKDDLKVEVENGVLNVEGERKREKEEKGRRFTAWSVRTGSSSGGLRCPPKSTPRRSRRNSRTASWRCICRRRSSPSRNPSK